MAAPRRVSAGAPPNVQLAPPGEDGTEGLCSTRGVRAQVTPMPAKFDIKGFMDAWNTHDANRIAEYYAEDTEILVPPDTEPYRGKDGVRQNVKDVTGGLEDVNADIAWTAQEGNKVCALIHVTGRHAGEMVISDKVKIPATNKDVRFMATILLDIDDKGKIKRETDIVDNVSLLQQVGAMQKLTAGQR